MAMGYILSHNSLQSLLGRCYSGSLILSRWLAPLSALLGSQQPQLQLLLVRRYPGGVKKVPDLEDHPKRRRGRHVHRIPNSQYRGFTFSEGSIVHARDVVLRQIGLQFYPGENVRLNPENWDLVAESDGRLLLSTEVLEPFPGSPLHDLVQAGQVFEKVFVHVVRLPERELKGEYSLVSLI